MGSFYDGVSNVWIVRTSQRGSGKAGLDIDGHKTNEDAAMHLLHMDAWRSEGGLIGRLEAFKKRIEDELQHERDEEAFYAAREALIDKAPKKCPDCGCEELHNGSAEDQGECIHCTECDWYVALRSIYEQQRTAVETSACAEHELGEWCQVRFCRNCDHKEVR